MIQPAYSLRSHIPPPRLVSLGISVMTVVETSYAQQTFHAHMITGWLSFLCSSCPWQGNHGLSNRRRQPLPRDHDLDELWILVQELHPVLHPVEKAGLITNVVTMGYVTSALDL